MSRKVRKIRRRGVEPDLVYNNLLASRFINIIMHEGKKSVARRIFYTALERVAEKSGAEPIEAFNQAIENIRPGVEVRSRRVGGANYQIPVEVRPERQMALAMRWLLGAARSRGERTMSERLSGEILDACKKGGAAVKKREDTHRMAEANKAFAHYRW